MAHTIYQVDSFTNKPFHGNPAGVCLLTEPADDNWMRSVAIEMNLSETAFLYPFKDGYRLRWFTPAIEVDLCGHATLATAHILWEKHILPQDQPAIFHTNSGVLTCRSLNKGIEMNFPATPPEPFESPSWLLPALGITSAAYVGKNIFDIFVVVSEAAIVRQLTPNFSELKKLKVRGVIITARSDKPEYDIVSRYFAPGAGIDEDPVTGSAHCTIGPYWSALLDKNPLRCFQASKRGGEVEVFTDGDRVKLCGQALTVMEITLL